MPMNQGQTGVRKAPFARNLTVRFARDGTARLTGAIRFPAITPATAPYAPLLRALDTGAQAACADSDGDGRAGLTRLEGEFQVATTGARVPVILTPTEHDVDADGVYEVALQIDDVTLTGETRFRVPRERPPRRR
jgi:hypothetical protein